MEYAILNGDKKIGVSYMKMSEGLDEALFTKCMLQI